jgi:hypothetical protein
MYCSTTCCFAWRAARTASSCFRFSARSMVVHTVVAVVVVLSLFSVLYKERDRCRYTCITPTSLLTQKKKKNANEKRKSW